MPDPERGEDANAWGGLAALGGLALAIGCCGAVPLLAVLAGSVAIGTVLGIAAGAAALTLLIVLLIARQRRRRVYETPGLPATAAEEPRARKREVVR